MSIVTITLSLTIQPQFAIRCLRRSNQRWGTIWEEIEPNLTPTWRDMGLSYAKETVSAYNARTWQTDRQSTER